MNKDLSQFWSIIQRPDNTFRIILFTTVFANAFNTPIIPISKCLIILFYLVYWSILGTLAYYLLFPGIVALTLPKAYWFSNNITIVSVFIVAILFGYGSCHAVAFAVACIYASITMLKEKFIETLQKLNG